MPRLRCPNCNSDQVRYDGDLCGNCNEWTREEPIANTAEYYLQTRGRINGSNWQLMFEAWLSEEPRCMGCNMPLPSHDSQCPRGCRTYLAAVPSLVGEYKRFMNRYYQYPPPEWWYWQSRIRLLPQYDGDIDRIRPPPRVLDDLGNARTRALPPMIVHAFGEAIEAIRPVNFWNPRTAGAIQWHNHPSERLEGSRLLKAAGLGAALGLVLGLLATLAFFYRR